LVAYRFFGGSLFDVQLAARGVDLSLGRDKAILENRSIKSYISQAFTQIRPNQTLLQVKNELLAAQQTEAYCVDEAGCYRGTLTLQHIVSLEQQNIPLTKPAADYAELEHLILLSDTSIWDAMEQLGDFVGESIPVINTQDDGVLLGVVFEAALVKAYLHTMYDIRREEHAAS